MIIAILGPTAVGKTKLSIMLAKKYQADIINFDSMQVYKDLDIGTAKVTSDEMENVRHHLLSFVDIDKTYSVYDYQKDGRRILDQLLKEGKNVVLVGGTGLYLKALLYDYKFEEESKVNNYDELSNLELEKRINSYQKDLSCDFNNRRRMVRVLNKLENNEEISKDGNKLLYSDTVFIGLTTNRSILYDKINLRVDNMVKNGLLDEVMKFKEHFATSKALRTGIGYKEFIPYFDNKESIDVVLDNIKKNSRHYAKRQYTFFNHQFKAVWFNTCYDDFNKTYLEVLEYLKGR